MSAMPLERTRSSKRPALAVTALAAAAVAASTPMTVMGPIEDADEDYDDPTTRPLWATMDAEEGEMSGPTAHSVTQQAIFDGLTGVMRTLELQAAAVRSSQDELQREIARIQTGLRRFAESTKAPNLNEPARQLVQARGDLDRVNRLLQQVQERLDRMCSRVRQHQTAAELASSPDCSRTTSNGRSTA